MISIKRHKITIINLRRPPRHDPNEGLQWLGNSLGLFTERDKDKSCFRIFIELLKANKVSMPLSSDELAFKLNLTRGTVVHHLNKLMQAGIIISERNKYMLRVSNLKFLIDELEKDIQRSLNNLRQVAEEIDDYLGF